MPSFSAGSCLVRRPGVEQGRALLERWMSEAPACVAAVPAILPGLERFGPGPRRSLVTTGIGTSEGHARHLADVAARMLGWPARFVPTAALGELLPGAEDDWLVVFSQGLSANARHAFARMDDFDAVLLVTGADPEGGELDPLPAEKRAFLADFEGRGGLRIDLGCGLEYGALLRVKGARAGYAVAWSLLRTIAAARLADASRIEIEAGDLAAAQRSASETAERCFPASQPIGPFFAADRSLVLVSQAGSGELVEQLTLKIAEGMLRPQPRMVDVLQYAHGPLQSLAQRKASLLYFETPDDPPEWLERFRATLDPSLHDLRVIRSTLAWPFAAIEFEAVLDAIILRTIDERGHDLVAWPGADREQALYGVGPELLNPGGRAGSHSDGSDSGALDPSTSSRGTPRRAPLREPMYERLVWPEFEQLIESGRRTALLGLGSIEQHGPHLPLGTDRWIADALLTALEARLQDAVALPAIPVGCASEHLDFAGTLHVEPATLEAMLGDLLRSLAHHGFERAFLFTAHGGNVDALTEMRARLEAAASPIELRIELDQKIGAMQAAVVEAESLSAAAAGPHAGEYETSLVAHLRAGSVRAAALEVGRLVSPGEAQALFYPSLRPHATTGVLGDPSEARASRGARYLEAWVEILEAAYRAAFD